MSMTFTKLFSSITESSVWSQDDQVRLVWITMLAMADKRGRVWASVPGLAHRARVSIDDAERALKCFLEPDHYSRTKEFGGRRIETIDGGWRLLNHQKYRDIRDEEERREQNAEAQARFRKNHVIKVMKVSQSKPESARSKPNAEADAEADAEALTPPSGVKGGASDKLAQLDQLGALYNRKRKQWSYAEESVFSELSRRADFAEELDVIIAYRSGLKAKDVRYFPQSLSRLLSNWDEVLDRAKGQSEIEPKSPMERDIDNLCK